MKKESLYFGITTFVIGVVITATIAIVSLPPPPCNDTGRYASTESPAGVTYQPTNGQIWSDNFKSTTGSLKRGVFISKRAFDAIFSNRQFNGIVFYFAQPDPLVKNFQLLFEGDNHSQTAVSNLQGGLKLYSTDTYCPVCCGVSIHD